jgi:phosphoribosylamine---glycine ligase
MKLLIIDGDGDGSGLDLAMRASDWSHAVKYYLPPHIAGDLPYGKDLVERSDDWESQMDWADLVVLIGNTKYQSQLAEYFGRSYPIFGTNEKAAELELDRGRGQEVLAEYGVQTAPYVVVDSIDDAIAHIARTGKPHAIKPWGGMVDKSLTCVCDRPDDAIFTLQKWKSEGRTADKLMLQEKVDGVEIGIAAWFGPAGWSKWKEESFEHKKFLTGDLGENTGEMGTVIRHVRQSKLFDMILEPLTEYLHFCNYVGDVAVNCIVNSKGIPLPLEFTMRLGWPDFNIRQAVIEHDPIQWMLDLLHGNDTFRPLPDVALGVLMVHGDFPRWKDPMGTWEGFPIRGVAAKTEPHLHFQHVRRGKYPWVFNGKVRYEQGYVTAGNCVMTVTGSGGSVGDAKAKAYSVVEQISWPSNVMYRLDIGDRLEADLPLLQKHGFAVGMRY